LGTFHGRLNFTSFI